MTSLFPIISMAWAQNQVRPAFAAIMTAKASLAPVILESCEEQFARWLPLIFLEAL